LTGSNTIIATAGCCTGCGSPLETRHSPLLPRSSVRSWQPSHGVGLYQLRTVSHRRLPDIDAGHVRRIAALSTEQLRGQVQELLRATG
jgi:hypothetical protein